MADDELQNATPDSSTDASSDDESDGEPVQLLVSGREKRKTAGNRYDRDMILDEAENEEDPDEVALLFADGEEDEDEEFKSDDADDDADMSSSDDDDQGPNVAAGGMEGEQEIEKEAKAERAKKRKADLVLTTTSSLRKRPKIDPTQMQGPVTLKKPTKRKERTSWVPGQEVGKGRTSLRKQTIEHRAITIARLKESEAHSKKLKALKEKRNLERAKDAPRELTQADRLAEAARIERRNAKSLNRWEAMEKKKTEEQAARLAALKVRTLDGAVITFSSTKAKWLGPKLNRIGTKDLTTPVEGPVEAKKRGRKPKAYHEQIAAAKAAEQSNAVSTSHTPTDSQSVPFAIVPFQPESTLKAAANTEQQPQVAVIKSQDPDGLLPGIHEYAMQPESEKMAEIQQPLLGDTPTEQESHPVSIESMEIADSSAKPEAPPSNDMELGAEATPAKDMAVDKQGSEPAPQPPILVHIDQAAEPLIHTTDTPQPESNVETPVEDGPQTLLKEEFATRNLVILDKFENLPTENKHEFAFFQNSKKSARPVKHSNELCPITTLPVRYKDPATGIGYANMFAYKKLQELKDHSFGWSSMLGCYVGRVGGTIARGVPEGFVGP